MRRWQSHKIVEAEPIVAIDKIIDDVPGAKPVIPVHVQPDIHGDDLVHLCDPLIFARGAPRIGDYLVVYPDGYVSWSPKKAFEEGYTEVK